jgi:hypothetical protein
MKIRRSLFNMSDVAWFDHPHGDHVPLPLDVSQVSDAVVDRVVEAMADATLEWFNAGQNDLPATDVTARAAITALAAALGEEG